MTSLKRPKCLTLHEKCMVIEEFRTGATLGVIARKYGVARSTICKIKQQKEEIQRAVRNAGGNDRLTRKTLRPPEFPLMEQHLHQWYIDQRNDNIVVDGKLMKEKAKLIHANIKESSKNFIASDGWLQKFKKRYGIHFSRSLCDDDPLQLFEPDVTMETYDSPTVELNVNNTTPMSQLQSEALGLTLDQLYSVDEIGLYWKHSAENVTDLSSAQVDDPSKQRLIFIACTNASGNHKVKPLIIGRSINPKSLKVFGCPVDYSYSKTAFFNSTHLRKWFQQSFMSQVTSFLKHKGLPIKVLLLINSSANYLTEDKLKNKNEQIIIMHLPPMNPIIRNHLLADIVENVSFIKNPLRITNTNDSVIKLMTSWKNLNTIAILNCWRDSLKELELNNNLSLSILSHDDSTDVSQVETKDCLEALEALLASNDTTVDLKMASIGDYSESQLQTNNEYIANAFNIVIQWAAMNNNVSSNDLDVLHKLREQAVNHSIIHMVKSEMMN